MATLASITIDSQTFNLKSLLNYLFIIFFYYLKYTLNTENSLADLNLFYSFCCSYFFCVHLSIYIWNPVQRSGLATSPSASTPCTTNSCPAPGYAPSSGCVPASATPSATEEGRQQALSASVLSISATPHRGGALGAVPLALRRLGNAYARIMEPFVGAGVIVTGHHVAIGHLVAGAITWLIGII